MDKEGNNKKLSPKPHFSINKASFTHNTTYHFEQLYPFSSSKVYDHNREPETTAFYFFERFTSPIGESIESGSCE